MDWDLRKSDVFLSRLETRTTTARFRLQSPRPVAALSPPCRRIVVARIVIDSGYGAG